MKKYKHGVEVNEIAIKLPPSVETASGVQVIIGTANINQVKEPKATLNKPVLIENIDQAKVVLGYSKDMKYTANQAIYANFEVHKIAPFIFINVLDADKHKKSVGEAEYDVKDGKCVIADTGVLINDKLIVKNDTTLLQKDTDYVIEFNLEGHLVINLITGADTIQKLKIAYDTLDETKVTKEEIIGKYNIDTGVRTGIQLIDTIYPTFNMTVGLIIVPDKSCDEDVAGAMTAKCENLNGVFRAECLIDLECNTFKNPLDAIKKKQELLLEDPHQFVFYPKVKRGSQILSFSIMAGALMSAMAMRNGGTPEEYFSNKELKISAVCDDEGEPIILDQITANELNKNGIITAIRNNNKLVAWGNETAVGADYKDLKDRFTGIRRMFTYIDNSFILTCNAYIDGKLRKVTVDNILNNFNQWGSSLVSSGKIAGLKAERLAEYNQIEQLLNGENIVSIGVSCYPPMQYIQGRVEFDLVPLVNELSAS